MDIYKKALKDGLLFETVRGMVTIGDLFNMELTSKDKFNLNDTAIKIAKRLDENKTLSFVETKSQSNADDELRLEILKDIIADKLADAKARKNAKEKAEKRQKILGILASKEDEALQSKTQEELLAELAALD